MSKKKSISPQDAEHLLYTLTVVDQYNLNAGAYPSIESQTELFFAYFEFGSLLANLHSIRITYEDAQPENMGFVPGAILGSRATILDAGGLSILDRPPTTLERATDLAVLRLYGNAATWEAVKLGYRYCSQSPEETEEVFEFFEEIRSVSLDCYHKMITDSEKLQNSSSKSDVNKMPLFWGLTWPAVAATLKKVIFFTNNPEAIPSKGIVLSLIPGAPAKKDARGMPGKLIHITPIVNSEETQVLIDL